MLHPQWKRQKSEEDKGKFLFEYLMIIKYLFYKTLGHFKVFQLLPFLLLIHELYKFMNAKFDSLLSFLLRVDDDREQLRLFV